MGEEGAVPRGEVEGRQVVEDEGFPNATAEQVEAERPGGGAEPGRAAACAAKPVLPG